MENSYQGLAKTEPMRGDEQKVYDQFYSQRKKHEFKGSYLLYQAMSAENLLILRICRCHHLQLHVYSFIVVMGQVHILDATVFLAHTQITALETAIQSGNHRHAGN